MRNLVIDWITTAQKLEAGDEIYIPAASRDDAKTFFKLVQKELKILKEIDPIISLTSYRTFKDTKHWVVIKKEVFSPTVGFLKHADGSATERINIDALAERHRRIKLMIQDRFCLEEIEEIEDRLTDEELEIFGLRRKDNDS